MKSTLFVLAVSTAILFPLVYKGCGSKEPQQVSEKSTNTRNGDSVHQPSIGNEENNAGADILSDQQTQGIPILSPFSSKFVTSLPKQLHEICQIIVTGDKADRTKAISDLTNYIANHPRDGKAYYLRAIALDKSDTRRSYNDFVMAARVGLPPIQQWLADDVLVLFNALVNHDANEFFYIGAVNRAKKNLITECTQRSLEEVASNGTPRSRYNEHKTILRKIEDEGYNPDYVAWLMRLKLENSDQLRECLVVIRSMVELAGTGPTGNRELVAAWARLGIGLSLKFIADWKPITTQQLNGLRVLDEWSRTDFGPDRTASNIRMLLRLLYGEEVGERRLALLRNVLLNSTDNSEYTRERWKAIIAGSR